MRRIDRLFWICAITAGIFFLFFPVLSKYLELKRSDEKLTGELRELQKKIQELERENYLIKHDAQHLEQVMRDELKLVKPGEVVYKLVPEIPEKSKIKSEPIKQNPPKNSVQQASATKLANQ